MVGLEAISQSVRLCAVHWFILRVWGDGRVVGWSVMSMTSRRDGSAHNAWLLSSSRFIIRRATQHQGRSGPDRSSRRTTWSRRPADRRRGTLWLEKKQIQQVDANWHKSSYCGFAQNGQGYSLGSVDAAYNRQKDLWRSGQTISRTGLTWHCVRLFGYHKIVQHGARLYLVPTVLNRETWRIRRRRRRRRLYADEYDIIEEWTRQWQHSAVNNAALVDVDDPSIPLYQDSRIRNYLEANGPVVNNGLINSEVATAGRLQNGTHRHTFTQVHAWMRKKGNLHVYTCVRQNWNRVHLVPDPGAD